jgi:hypothetical protein
MNIVDPVAVDVAGRAHRVAGVVARVDAGEHEARAAVATAAGPQARERQYRRETLRRTEHHIALARPVASARIGEISGEDDIVDSVPLTSPAALTL